MKWIVNLLLGIYFFWVTTWFFICLGCLLMVSFSVYLFRIKSTYIYSFSCFACKWWLLVSGVFVVNKYEYPKNRPSTVPVIFIANHVSYLDIPTLYAANLSPFMFLAKMELGRIPIFGFLCSRLTITVQRESVRSRSASIQYLMHILQHQKTSIFIFPEGTFNETGDELFVPFQLGAFSIAIKTQTPIYPILLLDTKIRMNDKHWLMFRAGINRIIHLEMIDDHLHQTLSAYELMHICQNKMTHTMKKYNS